MDWLIWLLYIVMVAVPIVIALPEIPKRIKSLRRGAKGIKYTPLALLVLFSSAIGALMLAEALPILKWGWLGYNIIFGGLFGGEVGGQGQTGIIQWIITAVILTIAVLSSLIFNYYEEEGFRKSYRLVALWALIHLTMGIPLWAVIPIFSSGLLYKYIYDKHSVDHAFATHFTTNASLIFILIFLVFLTLLL